MTLRGSDRTRVIVAGVAVLLLVMLRLILPEPLNWRPTYQVDSTQPYGTRMVRELAPAMFAGQKVVTNSLPPYMVLRDSLRTPASFVLIDEFYEPDESEVGQLLRFAGRGNTIFIAAQDFGDALGDTLGVETAWLDTLYDYGIAFPLEQKARTSTITFTSRSLRGQRVSFPANTLNTFSDLDTARAVVLARIGSKPVLIRMPHGRGQIILCSIPRAFTNYYMVRPTTSFFARVALSYLPSQPVLWDAYYASGERGTPLRYVLGTRPLRLALFASIVGAFLFVVNAARRRQRAVPIIKPPPNDTVDFTRTVAQLLLFRGGRHHVIARRVHSFYTWLRMEYGIDPGSPERLPDEDLLRQLSAKTGVPVEDLLRVFRTIQRTAGDSLITLEELHDLSHGIDEIYRLSHHPIA